MRFYIILCVICSSYFLYSISSILAPFMAGIIIAYLLNPLTSFFERYTSRGIASIGSLCILIVVLTVVILIIGPYLYHELTSLIIATPEYLHSIRQFLDPYIDDIYNKFGIDKRQNSDGMMQKISQYIIQLSSSLLGNIWSSSIALINVVALAIITPIVSFYLLRDWQNITKGFFDLIPRDNIKVVKGLCLKIDRVLSGYIRGQLNVCLLLGLFYAIGLGVVGLNYGILLGFASGALTIIPYFGIVIGMVIGIVIALMQYSDYTQVILVMSVFLIGQFIEGNFITPKLVGNKVGLHPAIIIFALLSGASLFGFIGILFAIPFAASLWILMSHFLLLYKKSSSYK
ncbi:MAG: AI-2E family transporter [Rickettsiales bacterium]|nr:AI-2E family transporter [Rickettsiales bacterium]